MKKTERNSVIVMLINRGLTYAKISKIFNITTSRIKDINKATNSDELKNGFIECVNCGITSGGDVNSKYFMFGNDSLNVCMPCVKKLQTVDNSK